MNKAILTGRMTKDPEERVTKDGTSVANFTVACDRGKDQEGKDRGADFINCVAWGKTAEHVLKYTRKGSKVAIDGQITTGSYEKDGKKVYTTNVTAARVEFLDPKPAEKPAENPIEIDDDFMPL